MRAGEGKWWQWKGEAGSDGRWWEVKGGRKSLEMMERDLMDDEGRGDDTR